MSEIDHAHHVPRATAVEQDGPNAGQECGRAFFTRGGVFRRTSYEWIGFGDAKLARALVALVNGAPDDATAARVWDSWWRQPSGEVVAE